MMYRTIVLVPTATLGAITHTRQSTGRLSRIFHPKCDTAGSSTKRAPHDFHQVLHSFNPPTVVVGLAIPTLGLPLLLDIQKAMAIMQAAISLIAALISIHRAS